MRSNLVKMNFPYESMKLYRIYDNSNYIGGDVEIKSETIFKVLGEDLIFSKNQSELPYVYNSVVMSIDGKIAFEDVSEGPLIASKNLYAKTDSLVDWWILNLLRSSADAILFGANTLKSEKNATGHVYDQNLEDARIKMGKPAVPINVIPTLDGLDVPFEHIEFNSKDIPILFFTVNSAIEVLLRNIPELIILGPFKSIEEVNFDNFIPEPGKKYAMICGLGLTPDPHIAMKVLSKLGVKKLLVESPMISHIFLKEKLMDELFINISCIYVGGNALSIGKKGESFDSINHPHTELIKIYMQSPNFMFTRHRVIK